MFRHLEALLLVDRYVLAVNGSWMEWNLFLAAIPIALAWLLFGPVRKRGALWYDRPALYGAVVPLFCAYFTVGFACYALALVRLRRYLLATATPRAATVAEISLHLLAAVGVVLGRVDRLNSWDIVTRPHSVLAAISNLAHGPPAVALALLAGAVVGAKAMFVWIGRVVGSSLRWAWTTVSGPAPSSG